MTNHTVTNWTEASAQVKKLAAGLPIYYGTGYPIATPHVTASTLDALSGEGMGYFVTIYPEGDTYRAPHVSSFIHIR